MPKKTIIVLLILGLVSSTFILTSCGPSKKEIMAQQEAEEAEKARMAAEEAEKARMAAEEAERARLAAEERERQRLAREAERARQAAEEAARKALMEMESEKIYFDYDKSDLKPEARAVLSKKAAWLRENTEYSIKIEGHCDERGSTEYNLALGERRADAAAKFLTALGVSESRVSTVSLGEEKPVDTRSNETAWAKNRRDEFVLVK
jgi:peptidoglycan-associated lipoprotein